MIKGLIEQRESSKIICPSAKCEINCYSSFPQQNKTDNQIHILWLWGYMRACLLNLAHPYLFWPTEYGSKWWNFSISPSFKRTVSFCFVFFHCKPQERSSASPRPPHYKEAQASHVGRRCENRSWPTVSPQLLHLCAIWYFQLGAQKSWSRDKLSLYVLLKFLLQNHRM